MLRLVQRWIFVAIVAVFIIIMNVSVCATFGQRLKVLSQTIGIAPTLREPRLSLSLFSALVDTTLDDS